MKKLLLAMILCTISFGAQAARDNIICSINGKTVVYEDVDVYFITSGTKIKSNKFSGVILSGLYTCVTVIRDKDGWEDEWKKAKKLLERPLE